MNKIFRIAMGLVVLTAVLTLCGCASDDGIYQDEQEYSSMPWNTPQSWEAGPAIPGMSPVY